MKRITSLLVLVGLLAFPGEADPRVRTISWSAVTTYTDNTLIEAQYLPVMYDIDKQDNVTKAVVPLATGVTATQYQFEDNVLVPGRTYIFRGRARLNNGAVSDNSVPYGWTLIYVSPKSPDNVITRK